MINQKFPELLYFFCYFSVRRVVDFSRSKFSTFIFRVDKNIGHLNIYEIYFHLSRQRIYVIPIMFHLHDFIINSVEIKLIFCYFYVSLNYCRKGADEYYSIGSVHRSASFAQQTVYSKIKNVCSMIPRSKVKCIGGNVFRSNLTGSLHSITFNFYL